MVIRRAQKVSNITMGGYVNLCLETLSKVRKKKRKLK